MDRRLRLMTDLTKPLTVPPGSTVSLSRDYGPGYTGTVKKGEAKTLLADGVQLLAEYQDRLAAQSTFGVLLALQGIDAAGKDGTVKHVMSGVNPHYPAADPAVRDEMLQARTELVAELGTDPYNAGSSDNAG